MALLVWAILINPLVVGALAALAANEQDSRIQPVVTIVPVGEQVPGLTPVGS
jgi:hypothetical protein